MYTVAQKQWSKKDIKQFLEVHNEASEVMTKKSTVYSDDPLLYVDSKPLYIYRDEEWIPSLLFALKYTTNLPKVTVDKGAIRFVINGADIMRPGIVKAEEFEKDSVVIIVDETTYTPIAVGRAMVGSAELLSKQEGKVISTLHHVKDELWEEHMKKF